MIFHGAPLAFEKEEDLPQVQALANRTWELIDFIVNGLGITEWPGQYNGVITVHRSCHLRGSKSGDAITTLLSSIDGLELGEFDEQEQCCGFGGTFSVSFPNISKNMGELKVENLTACKPDAVAAADMGCMMHFGGIMEKQGEKVERLHVAQILRDSLKNIGKV